MRFIRATLLACLAVVALCSAAPADTVHLTDGRKIVGQIVIQPDPNIVAIETPFGRLEFRSSEVAKVEYDIVAPSQPSGPTGSPIVSPGESATSRPDADTATLSQSESDLFSRASAEADRAMTAAEGLAVWSKFAADRSAGTLGKLARARIALWQGRVDKDQVRFGPGWLNRPEAERRNRLADSLLAEANKLEALDDAAKKYDEAAAANPYRVDIPFAKARRMALAKRLVQAAAGFDQALSISLDHPAALNNMGVLLARQKNWSRAFMYLTRAAMLLDNDVILDNLDLAAVLAQQAGCPRQDLAAVERQIRQIVQDRHKAGKRVGQTRWGNTWVPQAQLDQLAEAYAKMEVQYASNAARKAALERDLVIVEKNVGYLKRQIDNQFKPGDDSPAYRALAEQLVAGQAQERKIRDEIRRLQDDNDAMLAKRKDLPHADKFVLLDADGKSELMSFPIIRDASDVKTPGDKPAGDGS